MKVILPCGYPSHKKLHSKNEYGVFHMYTYFFKPMLCRMRDLNTIQITTKLPDRRSFHTLFVHFLL